ncbi:uncharacterized protein LOC120210728 [Hibiscus syriacus]|uniref:uncharacterized protein LOC120210728 n=1 Tax=Hibiscus syriacus TaxID=106335 RepID=UPI0019230A7C|nr:uncharacterized protein LOC120210728 [Hibiscus syriacus]
MRDFEDITQELGLQDHPYFGPSFTWSNKQHETFLARKLDRVLINPYWFSSFHQSFVEFTTPGISDHCMAIVWLSKEISCNRSKPFKFFNFWTIHSSFMNEVKQSWNLNKDSFSDLSARVRQKGLELELQQLLTLKGEDVIENEQILQSELSTLEDEEVMFLKQKAKVQWLKEGDKCSKFFYSRVVIKNKRDTIRVLVNDQGNRLETFDGMTAEVSSSLVKEVTKEEIKEAIFSQGNDKAPGPDDFTPFFSRKHGLLLGARGIRQGDPFSPFLFVLTMNMLSRMLNLAATRGNVDSIVGVISVLDQFYDMSGLKLNASKSEFFAAGISSRTLDDIKQISGFKYGILPVRYLGVPLVTRKLSEKECNILIEKIKARLHHWAEKTLSYTGKLELIRSVLFNMANYWCSQLILPQSILNKIDQLCSQFFWKGTNKAASGARISWEKVCQSKSERGIGIKNTKSWNKTCLLHLIRKIISGEGSLWVVWLKEYVLKETNFWNLQIRPNTSCCIRLAESSALEILLEDPPGGTCTATADHADHAA